MTVFLHTFTEREKIYNFCESLTGARFTTSYTRIGGLARDLPPGWTDQIRQFCKEVLVSIQTRRLCRRLHDDVLCGLVETQCPVIAIVWAVEVDGPQVVNDVAAPDDQHTFLA